jgi:hypothetical protein
MNRLESLSEKKLREAIENGEFDDLPGNGEKSSRKYVKQTVSLRVPLFGVR